jgi:hypothetical protein
MSDESNDPKVARRRSPGWREVAEWLEEFPPPDTTIDHEGYVTGAEWVFRGVKNSRYDLKPAIEREAESNGMGWPALEVLISSEFKSRARMHLSPSSIPEDELTWLAHMQHYSVPTRLLDFTYSPFVALYFAIRDGTEAEARTHVRLWAIDAAAVNSRFQSVASTARSKQKQHDGVPTALPLKIGDPETYSTDRENMIVETDGLRALIAESLSPRGTHREELNRQGCVCVASPPAFNPRLVSQQGVFLANCAQDFGFNESLTKMMDPRTGWRKKLDIPISTIPEIERKLFQMNIHEQSLFPDMEGLAGLIRQKARLHWR